MIWCGIKKVVEVSEVIALAKIALNQWINPQDTTYDMYLGLLTQDDGVAHWQAPNEEEVKVNVDAAIFETPNCYSFALVARDHNGSLIEASSRCISGNIAPEMAEAMGIREALSWVKQKIQAPCIIETDCLIMVQAIRSTSIKLSYLGRLVEDARLC